MTTPVPAPRELSRTSPTPLYQQLEESLRTRIASGEWAPGARIPSENELNRIYGLSRMTVRGVLNSLVADGLLFRVPGKGTYVSEAKIQAFSPAYRGVREQLESQGIATSTRLLSMEVALPPRKVALQLQIDEGQSVVAIERVRSAHGAPVSLHRSWVPVSLAPDLTQHDPVEQQLCVILSEHYGLTLGHVEEELESTSLNAADASLLEATPGLPVLILEDTISTSTGVIFEYSRIIFRGDKVRLHFSLDT